MRCCSSMVRQLDEESASSSPWPRGDDKSTKGLAFSAEGISSPKVMRSAGGGGGCGAAGSPALVEVSLDRVEVAQPEGRVSRGEVEGVEELTTCGCTRCWKVCNGTTTYGAVTQRDGVVDVAAWAGGDGPLTGAGEGLGVCLAGAAGAAHASAPGSCPSGSASKSHRSPGLARTQRCTSSRSFGHMASLCMSFVP